eukprot:Lankesteria_metandrocarpae@DN2521_c0_g1_i1.p1
MHPSGSTGMHPSGSTGMHPSGSTGGMHPSGSALTAAVLSPSATGSLSQVHSSYRGGGASSFSNNVLQHTTTAPQQHTTTTAPQQHTTTTAPQQHTTTTAPQQHTTTTAPQQFQSTTSSISPYPRTIARPSPRSTGAHRSGPLAAPVHSSRKTGAKLETLQEIKTIDSNNMTTTAPVVASNVALVVPANNIVTQLQSMVNRASVAGGISEASMLLEASQNLQQQLAHVSHQLEMQLAAAAGDNGSSTPSTATRQHGSARVAATRSSTRNAVGRKSQINSSGSSVAGGNRKYANAGGIKTGTHTSAATSVRRR